jgi:hypothetical protein
MTASAPRDAPSADGGTADGGTVDGGRVEDGRVDGGTVDGGRVEDGRVDGGRTDDGRADGSADGPVDGGTAVDRAGDGPIDPDPGTRSGGRARTGPGDAGGRNGTSNVLVVRSESSREPAVIAARVGTEASPTRSATMSTYRRVGPENPLSAR